MAWLQTCVTCAHAESLPSEPDSKGLAQCLPEPDKGDAVTPYQFPGPQTDMAFACNMTFQG